MDYELMKTMSAEELWEVLDAQDADHITYGRAAFLFELYTGAPYDEDAVYPWMDEGLSTDVPAAGSASAGHASVGS
jgi:hypothetical protein